MRKIIWKIIISGLAFAAYMAFVFATDHGIINLNRIEVSTDAQLSHDKVKIIESFFSINRKNDKEMFYHWADNDIVYDGKNKRRPETHHGENDFLVTYNDKYYFQFRQIKTENSRRDTYQFYFSQMDSALYLEVKILLGKFTFKQKMNFISNAQNLLANLPIDSAGAAYNGIELK